MASRMTSACSFVLSRRPTTLPAKSMDRGARCSLAFAPPRVGSIKGRSFAIRNPLRLLNLVLPVYGTARFVPAMAHGRYRPYSARDDQVQPVHVLHRLDGVLVVVRIDPHRPGALRAPVASALEV